MALGRHMQARHAPQMRYRTSGSNWPRIIVHGEPTEVTWSAEARTIEEANQVAYTAIRRLRTGKPLKT